MSSKVRFAVIGTNFITDNLLQVAGSVAGFELAGVFSRTQERATEYAAKYDCATTFTDLAALARSDLVDAVYIASPTSEHAKQAILMLEHGKHVLCEKPSCSHSRELEAVLAAAKSSNCTFMEAMRPLKTPNFGLVKQALVTLGPAQHFTGTFCQLSSRWPAYLEGKRPNAFLPELSNGALMDLGCYAVYCAVGLFGAPTTVSYAATMLPTGVDSGGVLTLRYEGEGQALSKPHVTLIISKSSHSFNHSEIQTENGTIRINNLGDWSDVHLQKKGGQPENIGVEHNPNNMVYELEAFIKLVQKGQQEDELLTWSLAREVLTVLDQARASAGIVYPADSN